MKLLKFGGIFFRLNFSRLVNVSSKQRIIPDNWSGATVKSVFMKRDRKRCDNYKENSISNSGH
jgi:hypothetical protein